MILQNKLQSGMAIPNFMKNTPGSASNKQLQQQLDMYNIHWKQKYDEQANFIARLMDKMKKEFNIDPSQLEPIFMDMSQSPDYDEVQYGEQTAVKLMDFIVTFGKQK